MSSDREPDGPSESATAHLRGLLDLARLVRPEPELTEVFAAVARTVSRTLGFATVAINIYRPETDDYQVSSVYGNDRAREVLLGRVTSAAGWASMLNERFLASGVYFIPGGALEWDDKIASYTPDLRPAPAGDESAWRADDALLAILQGSGGRRYGIISVDEPQSGRRPDDELLEVLSAVAAHAGLAIESSHQFAQLEATLARHRAVLESSLDSVIAIDRHGRVLEFNPAAERTFGYRRQDVLGRELAELIVPPESRESYVRGLTRGFEQDDWRLLGQRIETTGLRADGTRLPVELALTLVPRSHEEGPLGSEEGPVVYGFVRDISERRRGEEQLTYLAYHDPLTGLPNRILVEQQLDLALAQARRARGSVVMMFVDLDDFKEVNDRLGHAAGDRLLAAVATRLRGVLRDSDLLARQGGDEFIVLLTDRTEDPEAAAESVGGKLLDALREPFVVAGRELRTGASIGISIYPHDAADTEALLRHADVAMYQAKTAGGGRLAFHQATGPSPSRRISIASQLRRAITRSELELHYQPIWQLGPSRAICGVEALIRWRHPERGLLAPQAFIGAAEQSAAGEDLMDWTLREACRQAREWAHSELLPKVSLNVSPQQLRASGFAGQVLSQIRHHELQASQFTIELTESAWTVDSAVTLSVAADLRAGGVGLAIDEFGAGYSSLSRLRELGFDVIKLDRRLLADIPADPTAVAVLRAILDLGTACGAGVIAQGVETEDQLQHLVANGIFQAQGFLFGKPLTAERLTQLLGEHLIEGRAVA
ncbi:MAG TPA: EAL domain-containing protein [Solirubrobacteraceae bacterium]|jgi:diguanylate cyclase (GGDEF)-like protein/PAS domain S-box-containing protein